jgi:hypothetical protein
MKKLLIILFTLSSLQAFALPKHYEVWFLSVDKVSWLDNVLKTQKNSIKLAQRALQCQQMGDYCFDPQVGLYKRGEEGKVQEEIDLSTIENNKKYDFLEPHNGLEREMIECDESQMFDIFCGKAQKKMKAGKTKLEVWVDTSTTMKQVDFDGFENECRRERFLKDLNATCPMNKKVKVYYFEEFRKEAGSFDRVCLSGGLNNMKRIVQNLKSSESDNVIIITDIFEAETSFIDAIEASGRGKIRGLKKPLYAKDLKTELKRVRKMCE